MSNYAENYQVRRNLSFTMGFHAMLTLGLNVMNGYPLPLVAFAVLAGDLIAVCAHRILFPYRWTDFGKQVSSDEL